MVTNQTKWAQIFDLRFPNHFLHDADILRRYVVFPMIEEEAVECRPEKRMRTALEDLLDERSSEGPAENEVVRFLRATRNEDFTLEPLGWFPDNETCFAHNDVIAKDVLGIHSSSVAIERCFFCAGNLMSDHRWSPRDDVITACRC